MKNLQLILVFLALSGIIIFQYFAIKERDELIQSQQGQYISKIKECHKYMNLYADKFKEANGYRSDLVECQGLVNRYSNLINSVVDSSK